MMDDQGVIKTTGNARRKSQTNSKKSVRWSNEKETRREPISKSFPPFQELPLCVLLVGLSGIIAAENLIDLGLARPIERLSRLLVPGFCVAFGAHRLSVHLADDRMKFRSFVALTGVCFAVEALMCVLVGDVVAPWIFSLVVFVAIGFLGVLTTVSANRVILGVAAVVVVRYVACTIFATLPLVWRPVLGYGFVILGILASKRRTLILELTKLIANFTVQKGHHTSDNNVRQRMGDDYFGWENASQLIPERRISLPIIKTPTDYALRSASLARAESTINQLLSADDVPKHVHSQLQSLGELLRLPNSQKSSVIHRRSKSIPTVTLSGASNFSQLCSDLPYTISEESNFAPKRFRRHFSVVEYGQASGIWTQNFFNSSSDSNYAPPARICQDAEENGDAIKQTNQLQNGHQPSDSSHADSADDDGSRIPGAEDAQDRSLKESPTRKANISARRVSLRISFAEGAEVRTYDSSERLVEGSEPEVSEVESDALKKLLDPSLLNQWDYPIFELALEAPDTMLSKVAYKIFTDLELMKSFEIPVKEFICFFQELERGYHDNPYHNRIHATDVLHAVYYMTTQQIYDFTQVIPFDSLRQEARTISLQSYSCENNSSGIMGANFLPLELMAMLTAAAMHDYDHPGRTNAFLVATCHPLAVLYNNRSVLENHHASASWSLLISDPKYAWLANLNDAEFKRFRYLVIDEILVTDLVQHFNIVSDFKTKFLPPDDIVSDGSFGIDWMSEDHRLVVSRVIVKMADINGPCKNWQLHKQWTERIAEEFYQQGDDEARMQLSVSPYMDRNQSQLAKLQESFITLLVTPLCDSLERAGLLPCYLSDDSIADSEEDAVSDKVTCIMRKHIEENYNEWVQLMKTESVDVTESS